MAWYGILHVIAWYRIWRAYRARAAPVHISIITIQNDRIYSNVINYNLQLDRSDQWENPTSMLAAPRRRRIPPWVTLELPD